MIKFLLAVILVELLTELVVKSVLFKPVRKKIKSINSWFKELLSCGYCFSHWSAFGVVLLLQLSYHFTGVAALDFLLTALILSRLSNFLHNANDKWLDKYYDGRFINADRGEE